MSDSYMQDYVNSDFIKQVKAKLEKTGWLRGQMGPAQGPNCVLGAAYALNPRGVIPLEYHMLLASVRDIPWYQTPKYVSSKDAYEWETTIEHTPNVAQWNDSTTKEDVMAALDEAIEIAEICEREAGV
jgi:hypothetical protein